ncbi:MAG: Peptidyl-prolyl cis-trans isomerase [uncultured Sulfurovum sp.]|uniref:Peptidyl-prolyl cis-trans isomerase n=1 Tax=uncultured Sulfurovum sp. TaxID=269237 RepID=A0A6S6UAF5_9BACT|nr:MAG: Peptidyl-prolyl cis-trans isomerase [uncultured Sulfurovum sp.]
MSIVTMDNGIKYEDLNVGTGQKIEPNHTFLVTVHYTMWLKNGVKIESTHDRDKPFQFKLGVNQVIKGWDEGMVGMEVGGVRQLDVPSKLAYGRRGWGGVIPPNSDLLFKIEYLGSE